MAIQTRGTDIHWNYFLALEDDLAALARYVEFSDKNLETYSIEIAHLLLAAASEVDVVMKLRCQQVGRAARSMKGYRRVLRNREPVLAKLSAAIPRFDITLTPWVNWEADDPLEWWTDHNLVKHRRDSSFSKATLKNLLNAMGGLFLLLLTYYAHDPAKDRLVPASSLFVPPIELAMKGHCLDGETGLILLQQEAELAGT